MHFLFILDGIIPLFVIQGGSHHFSQKHFPKVIFPKNLFFQKYSSPKYCFSQNYVRVNILLIIFVIITRNKGFDEIFSHVFSLIAVSFFSDFLLIGRPSGRPMSSSRASSSNIASVSSCSD